MNHNLNIGIVGAGGFALFAVNSFLKVPGIKVVAVTDTKESVARQLAAGINAVVHSSYEMLLEDDLIDLVYIATPPFLHYTQSKAALLTGKHVICEKPAALNVCEAEELSKLAESLNLLYVVNLMQRYGPLYNIVKTIVQKNILGNFLHGFFENYASDENLGSDHWFWNESKSGGIFIEHGVHFFDMFSGWLGEGKIIHAVQLHRPDNIEKVIDRVQATLMYDEGIVNFYHGFDQPGILDRQEMRLQFERGDVTLYGWIPVRMRLHGLIQMEDMAKMRELMPDPSVVSYDKLKREKQKVKGRFSDIVFDSCITIEHGDLSEKNDRYQEMLTAFMHDQWRWIRDRNHIRIVDATNAVQSLKMADAANRMAKQFYS